MGGGTGSTDYLLKVRGKNKMNEETYYKFLINNEEKYRRVKALLENQKGLFKIDEGEDLIVYAYIHKDHEGFIVLDGLNDLDVEVRITKNIDRKIRKSLEKISRGKFK